MLRHREPPPLSCTPFDEFLIAALKSLPPLPPLLTLAWLSAAFDHLVSNFLAAASILPDTSFAATDFVTHLDSIEDFLEACNDITSLIHTISRRRLLLSLALHFLPDLRRSRSAIAEFEASLDHHIRRSTANLFRDLSRTRKIPTAGREIYAVEAVAALVTDAALVMLGSTEKADLAAIRAPEEFAWAEAFNMMAASVYGKLGEGGVGEVAAAKIKASYLAVAIDGGKDGERMKRAVQELETATEELAEGVERLENSVDRVFLAGLTLKNKAMMHYRLA